MIPHAATAQDLFELEVFEFESAAPGEHHLELHTNALSSGGVASGAGRSEHRPAHVSVELTRGWTNRLETAVFLQTAPFGRASSARFAGGHIRGKVQLGELGALPLRVALSGEYSFNRSAFDDELQALEVRTILDYTRGRLSLVANPAVELVTRGSDEGLEPVFDISARAGWSVAPRARLVVDYFSAAATARHLQPEPAAHHLMFGGVDLEMGGAWELSVGAGHCVTSGEPWLLKSVVGFRF